MTNRSRRYAPEPLEPRTAPVVVVPLPPVPVQVAPHDAPTDPPNDPMPDSPAGPVGPA